MRAAQNFLVTLAVCLAALPCAASGQISRTDDAAVYSAALDSLMAYRKGQSVVLASRTRQGPNAKLYPERSTDGMASGMGSDSILWSDFISGPASTQNIPALTSAIVRLQVVEDSVLASHGQYWQVVSRRFPGFAGIVSFTGITYSRDGLRAIVDVMFDCGGLCRRTHLTLLEKSDGFWRVKRILLFSEA